MQGIITASIGLFLVFTSHTVSALIILYLALICAGAAVVSGFFKLISLRVSVYILLSVVWGISLAAFFLFPAFTEQKLTGVSLLTQGGSDFRSHFVYFSQFWDSPWGFAGSASGLSDGMSFIIGKLHILLAILSLILLFFRYYRKKLTAFNMSLITCCLSLVLLSAFLMLDVSKPLWEILPFFSYIQYPWRFLSFTILGFCVLIAMGLRFIPLRLRLQTITLTLFAIILFNQKLFVPSYIYHVDDSLYTDISNLTGKLSKISDEYLPANFKRDQYPDKLIWRNPSALLSPTHVTRISKSNYRSYEVFVPVAGTVAAPLAYFPGWKVSVNGDAAKKVEELDGLSALELTQGTHRVEFTLSQTTVEKLSNLISILSAVLLVYVSLILKRKAHEETLS